MRSCRLLGALCVMLQIAVSCSKKNTGLPSQIVIYSTGAKMTGTPIKFSSNVGSGNAFMWDFGDSTTSGEATPAHTYTSEGFRTVRLTINNNSAKAASVNIGVFNDPVYTSQVAGSRSWGHFYVLNHSGYPADTTTYGDTVFDVKMVDVFTITIANDTLSYYHVSDSVLGFQRALPSTSSDDLLFNHYTSTVRFTKFRHISAGANSFEYYTSL